MDGNLGHRLTARLLLRPAEPRRDGLGHRHPARNDVGSRRRGEDEGRQRYDSQP
jgi:hypothetical protein